MIRTTFEESPPRRPDRPKRRFPSDTRSEVLNLIRDLFGSGSEGQASARKTQLGWEDSRRLVFQTAQVMCEVDRPIHRRAEHER